MAGNINGMELLFGSGSGAVEPVQQAAPKPISGMDLLFGEQSKPQAPAPAKPKEEPGGLLKRLGTSITGTQDPAYKDVPDFRDDANALGSGGVRVFGSTLLGADDAQLGDVTAKSLGDKVKRRFKDANGYELIEFTAPDGTTQTRYINKPGLDARDVARGVFGAIPYAVGGVAGAVATKGIPMLGRAMAQAGIGGSTSVAGDLGNQALGSEQAVDLKKAGVTAVMGGAAEAIPAKVLAPLIGGVFGATTQMKPESSGSEVAMGGGLGAAAGTTAMALARYLKMNPGKYVDKAGELTPAGEKLVVAQGLDPAQMSALAKQEFAKTYATSRSGTEAAVRAETAPFGIPTTHGQRTKEYQKLLDEENMRAGNKGDAARLWMQDFDNKQKLAIARAAVGRDPAPAMASLPGSARPPRYAMARPEHAPGVGQTINPENYGQVTVGPGGAPAFAMPGQAARGDNIRSGVGAAQKAGKEAEKEAWDKVGPLTATEDGLSMLPQAVKDAVLSGGRPITPANTPNAHQMLEIIKGMRGGPKQPGPGDEYLPDFSAQGLDQTRRTLLAMSRGGKDETDRAASKTLHSAYVNWMDDAAKVGGIEGDLGALTAARGVSKDWKGSFNPLGSDGRPTAAAAKIKAVLNQAEAPERIVRNIIGDVTSRSTPSAGTLETIKSLKTILLDRTPTRKNAELTATAKQTFDEIGSAYWERLVFGRNGEIATPQVMLTNIKNAQTNQGSVMGELYPPEVMAQIKQLERALEVVAAPHPNPSKSAIAGMSMVKNLISTIASAVSASKVVQGGIGLASPLLRPMADAIGGAQARKATSQAVRESPPSFGGYGAALGNTWERTDKPMSPKDRMTRQLMGGN